MSQTTQSQGQGGQRDTMAKFQEGFNKIAECKLHFIGIIHSCIDHILLWIAGKKISIASSPELKPRCRSLIRVVALVPEALVALLMLLLAALPHKSILTLHHMPDKLPTLRGVLVNFALIRMHMLQFLHPPPPCSTYQLASRYAYAHS